VQTFWVKWDNKHYSDNGLTVDGPAITDKIARQYKSSAVAEMGDRLATTDMGRKWGGAAVGSWVLTGSPSNTMWPGPSPTSLPSGILIHPTVWPQL